MTIVNTQSKLIYKVTDNDWIISAITDDNTLHHLELYAELVHGLGADQKVLTLWLIVAEN